jgi:hypothetical protein
MVEIVLDIILSAHIFASLVINRQAILVATIMAMEESFSDFLNDDDFFHESAMAFTDNRFGSTSTATLKEHLESSIPHNTVMKVKWAVKLFQDWHQIWKARLEDDILKIYDDIDYMSASDMNYAMQYFIADVRKKDGSKFPPRTLKEIVAMLQHYCNNNLKRPWSFFKDSEFAEFRRVLDAEMKLSAREGNARPAKRSNIISFEDEEILWTSGALGSSNPRQLLNTLIYLLGTHCALRAASEHRALKFGVQSQLKIECVDGEEVLQYTECVSKAKNFRLKQSRMEHKQTIVHKNKKQHERCPIEIYKKYLECREDIANESFYLTPMNSIKNNIWYKNQPFGIHSIQKVTGNLMKSIGKTGHFTNTSNRRTAKTRLTLAGIPREISKHKTGHISMADEVYIQKDVMEKNMSLAIYGHSKSDFSLENATESRRSSLMDNPGEGMPNNNQDKIIVCIENGAKKAKIIL